MQDHAVSTTHSMAGFSELLRRDDEQIQPHKHGQSCSVVIFGVLFVWFGVGFVWLVFGRFVLKLVLGCGVWFLFCFEKENSLNHSDRNHRIAEELFVLCPGNVSTRNVSFGNQY